MRTPEEFVHLVHCFYQGSDEKIATMEDWVAQSLRYLNRQQQTNVKAFLEDLLAGKPDDAELQRIWWDTGPDYSFPGESLRGVLAMIRDQIK